MKISCQNGAALVIILALAACGSDDSASSAPQGGGGAFHGTPEPSKSAILSMMSPSALDAKNYWIWGAFTDDPTPRSCELSAIGACEHKVCRETSEFDSKTVSAGTMQVKIGTKDYTIVPKSLSKIYAIDGTGLLWAGGEPIQISTPGDVAPAVSANVVAPVPVVFTSPAFPPSVPLGADPNKLAVDTSKDLEIAWKATSATTVIAEINWYHDAEGRSDSIRCSFSGGAGQGKIPAEALALMKADGANAGLSMMTEERSTQTVNDWVFELQAVSYGTTAAEDLAQAVLDLR